MKQLYCEGHFIERWRECKQQFRSRFWDDLHQVVLKEVKGMMEGMIEEEFNGLIGARPFERNGTRIGKRNGYYHRSFETRYGRITEIKIPRARDMDIRFSLFDKWQQVEEGVLESMLQAYLLGRSSSCAQKIIKGFGNSRFSRGFLQRLTHRFEENLQQWLNRPIEGDWPYVFLDGMVVRVSEGGSVQRWCVLWALGMDEQRNITVLGFLVLRSESQEGAERLLRDLLGRGLKPPKLIITDDSDALSNAAAMVFPHTPQQGCIFHKVKATGKYLQKKNRKRFLRQAANIYLKATGKRSLLNRLKTFKKRWRKREPEALKSLLRNFERTMSYLDFPKAHWSWIRTTNPLERFIEDVRDWTQRFGYFQGRGNLHIALFTYLCHKNPGLVPKVDQVPDLPKDTILIA